MTGASDEPQTATTHRTRYDAEYGDWVLVASELSRITAAEMERLGLETLVQARAKTPGSFERKARRIIAERGTFDYRKGIEDLAAVRIITHDRHDRDAAIDGFKQLVRDLGGSTREGPSAERVRQLSPWEFAYRSHHLTFQLPPNPSGNADAFWEVCRGRWIELQVRTVAEHAWAAVDHEYRYKSIAPLTGEATRTLFMISAQLEAIDFQLDHLRAMLERDLGPDGVRLRSGDMDVPVSSATTRIMLMVSERIQGRLGHARDTGWALPEPVAVHVEPESRSEPRHRRTSATVDEILAAQQELDAATELARVAEHLAIQTIAELETACVESLTDEDLAALASVASTHHLDTGLFPADLLGLSLVVRNESLPANFYPSWTHAVIDARRTRSTETASR